MATNNESIREIAVRKLVKDQAFRKLSPGGQDKLIDRFMQEEHGVVPQHENFLQKVAKNAGRFSPIGIASEVPFGEMPQVGFQTAQGTLGNLPQNIMENPWAFAIGGAPGVQMRSGEQQSGTLQNLFSGTVNRLTGSTLPMVQVPEKQIDLSSVLEPRSLPGQITAGAANLGAGALAPFGIARMAGKAKVVAEPTQNVLQRLIREAEELASGLGEKARVRIGEMPKISQQRFGETITGETSKATRGGFLKEVIEPTIKEMGGLEAREIKGSAPAYFAAKGKEILPSMKEWNQPMEFNYLKFQGEQIASDLASDPRARGVFARYLNKYLSDVAPKLAKAKAQDFAFREALKGVGALKKPAFIKIAKGTATPTEIERLSQLEKGLELSPEESFVSKLKAHGEKVRATQTQAESEKAVLLAEKVKKAGKKERLETFGRVAKGLGWTGGGLATLYYLMKKAL